MPQTALAVRRTFGIRIVLDLGLIDFLETDVSDSVKYNSLHVRFGSRYRMRAGKLTRVWVSAQLTRRYFVFCLDSW